MATKGLFPESELLKVGVPPRAIPSLAGIFVRIRKEVQREDSRSLLDEMMPAVKRLKSAMRAAESILLDPEKRQRLERYIRAALEDMGRGSEVEAANLSSLRSLLDATIFLISERKPKRGKGRPRNYLDIEFAKDVSFSLSLFGAHLSSTGRTDGGKESVFNATLRILFEAAGRSRESYHHVTAALLKERKNWPEFEVPPVNAISQEQLDKESQTDRVVELPSSRVPTRKRNTPSR